MIQIPVPIFMKASQIINVYSVSVFLIGLKIKSQTYSSTLSVHTNDGWSIQNHLT